MMGRGQVAETRITGRHAFVLDGDDQLKLLSIAVVRATKAAYRQPHRIGVFSKPTLAD
jgi:hypothetical protein